VGKSSGSALLEVVARPQLCVRLLFRKQSLQKWTIKFGMFCLRTLQPLVSEGTLRTVYFCYSHSILSYGIIFWENCSDSNKIFKLQNRAIRIITWSKNKESCRELFKKLNILPLYSQYILSISIHVIQIKHLYVTNQEIHNIGTRYKTNLHPPISNKNIYQKGPYYSGINIFNHLPENINKLSSNMVLFRSALKGFVYENSFYSIQEFCNYTWLLNL
jgi:hypothetical protein